MEHAGGRLDGGISSLMSLLLADWDRLKELRLINRSSVITRACPSLIIERLPMTQYSTENEIKLRQTADDLIRMKVPANYPLANPFVFNREKEVKVVIDAVTKGEFFDIKDGAVIIPAGYTISKQPVIEAFEIGDYERQFEADVLAVFKVPPSMFNSAKTGSGAINDGQKQQQSENDR